MSYLAQPQFITAGAAAEILGWSLAKVKRQARVGELPWRIKLDGRTGAYLFDRHVIEAIAAERAA